MYELGLEDQLMGTNDAHRKTFVLLNGKPYPMPAGLQLIVPTKFCSPAALSNPDGILAP